MGEWSDHFEEFPEENPANYDKDGRYDTNGLLRKEKEAQELANRKLDDALSKKGIPTKSSGND